MRLEEFVHRMAWHHTTGTAAVRIMADFTIRPATAGIPATEEPVVWFSVNPRWERSANKSLKGPDGSIRRLGFAETVSVGRGAGRFGLPVDKLIPWPAIAEAAHIAPKMVRALEQAAVVMGGDTNEWYRILGSVGTADCVFEYLDGDVWRNFLEEVNRVLATLPPDDSVPGPTILVEQNICAEFAHQVAGEFPRNKSQTSPSPVPMKRRSLGDSLKKLAHSWSRPFGRSPR
jgi:hypothetical protein